MADCIEIVWHRYVLAGDGVKQGLSEKVLQREEGCSMVTVCYCIIVFLDCAIPYLKSFKTSAQDITGCGQSAKQAMSSDCTPLWLLSATSFKWYHVLWPHTAGDAKPLLVITLLDCLLEERWDINKKLSKPKMTLCYWVTDDTEARHSLLLEQGLMSIYFMECHSY